METSAGAGGMDARVAQATRRAVVDIGSNSVRLVVYEGPPRAPIAICNEKALCGLGRDISDDGRLNAQAIADALATLTRFCGLLKEFGDPPTWTIATAAVREAANGAEFVASVRALGFDVEVISGAEEAELAALGVLSFEPDATGVAGDMGGGSLELVALKDGAIADSASLRIGPLSLMRETGGDRKKSIAIIERTLDATPLLRASAVDALYAVGGAWRALARINMRLQNYPLSVLHHYEMTSAQARNVCELVARQSRQSLQDIPGIPRRRLDTLPLAAIVMIAVMKRLSAKRVVVSAGGVREGLLYRALAPEARALDPFLTGCRFFAQRLSPNPACGEAVAKVVEPLFAHDRASAHLRYATSLLVDIGALFYPDLRARQAFDTALAAPFVSVSHADRIWMALALFSRHEGRSADWPNKDAIALLDEERQQGAVRFGLALRFAAAFAPKTARLLKGCRLDYEEGRLIFRAPAACERLMGETPRRRLDALASAFNAVAIEIYEG